MCNICIMHVTDKHGCKPDEAVAVVSHVLESCKQLEFVGLMTIGAIDYEPTDTEINPDFQVVHYACTVLGNFHGIGYVHEIQNV